MRHDLETLFDYLLPPAADTAWLTLAVTGGATAASQLAVGVRDPTLFGFGAFFAASGAALVLLRLTTILRE